MRALAPRDVLEAWENGADRSDAWRALALLDAAAPDADWDALMALPLGERDRRLLELRTSTLGPRIEIASRCPGCGEALELVLDAGRLESPPATATPAPGTRLRLERGELELELRPLTAGDLLGLDDCADPEDARRRLAERSVLAARRGGVALDGGSLDHDLLNEDDVAAIAEALAEADPRAEILLQLECPSCGDRWREAFDVAAFFWSELGVQAERLLRQVDALARAYGWREADVLALSPRRRRAYLEMIAG